MNIAYIYKLKNSEGLMYIGSHLVRKNKTMWSDNYSGSSQDLKIKEGIVSKEVLCWIKSEDRKSLYKQIQNLEHSLILKLNAINNKEYANASSQGVIGLNYKRLGGVMAHKKSPRSFSERSEMGKKGAKANAYMRTSEWHKKGQIVSAKSKRDSWTEKLYLKVQEAHIKYPDKKAYSLWSVLKKPTKNYKSIFHMLNHIEKGKNWDDIK